MGKGRYTIQSQRAVLLVSLTGVFVSLPESLWWLSEGRGFVAVAQEHSSGGHSGAGGHSGGKGGGHSGSDGHSGSSHSSGAGKGSQGGKGGLRDIYIPGTHGSGSKMLESEVFRSPGGHNRVIVPSEESVRSIIKGNKADTGSGRKPPWAGGAIPEEVELGRLNVARAPDHVLEKARQEVYANFDRDGNGVIDHPEDVRLVDSPLANLALYKEALVEGKWTLDQAAMFLGKASDKNLPLGGESLLALNRILQIDDSQKFADFSYVRESQYTPEEIQLIFHGETVVAAGLTGFAQAADDVRAVVLYYHDHPS